MGGRTSRRGGKDLTHGPTWLCPLLQAAGAWDPRLAGPAQPSLSEAQGFLRNRPPCRALGLRAWGFLMAGPCHRRKERRFPAPALCRMLAARDGAQHPDLGAQSGDQRGCSLPKGPRPPPQDPATAPLPASGFLPGSSLQPQPPSSHLLPRGPQCTVSSCCSPSPGQTDRRTDVRAHSHPSTVIAFFRPRLGPHILKAGDSQVTKSASQNSCHSPFFGPGGITPPSPARPRRPAEGLRLALRSQPGLACLQLEGLSPPGALQGGLRPGLRGREHSWCRRDRSRQLPVGNRNCQVLPSLRGDPETAGPEALQPRPACHPLRGGRAGQLPFPASTCIYPNSASHLSPHYAP